MSFFFFNDTATTEIYTLSLHDALPISGEGDEGCARAVGRDVHQDHRVGVDAGVGAGVEVGQLLVGEVRPAVVADQQQVHRLGGATVLVVAVGGDGVGAVDRGLRDLTEVPAPAGPGEQDDREHPGDGARRGGGEIGRAHA